MRNTGMKPGGSWIQGLGIKSGAAQAIAREQQRREEAGHGVEDRHPEDVDDAERPVERAGELGLPPWPAAARRIGDDSVEIDAEKHHRRAQGVERMKARSRGWS